MSDTSPPPVCSVVEATKLLTLSKPTIYKLFREGRILGVMAGNKLLINRSSLYKFIGEPA